MANRTQRRNRVGLLELVLKRYGQSMARSMHVRRPATLASLAAELGVSRTTVSNAYNRPDQLSPELRRRVLETARRLGSPGPDPVARSLRTRKAGAVGLLLTENLSYAFRDPAALGFLEGLALACEVAGQGLHLVPVNPEREDVAAVHRAGVDGFVVYSVPDDAFATVGVDWADVPVVGRFDHSSANGASAAAQLLDTAPDVTALICTS